MTAAQLAQLLTVVVAFARPFVERTGTTADDAGLEFVESLRDSPAMLEFIAKRFNNPQELEALAARLAS